MYHRDLRGALIGMSPEAEYPFLGRLTKRETYRTAPASDHFVLIDLQLPYGIRDFELGLAFTLRPSDRRRAGFVKLARLDVSGVSRTDNPDRAEVALIGHVELEVPSGFSLRSCEPGDDIYFPDPLASADGKERNSIRFIHLERQMEVLINERRVLYQPTRPDVPLRRISFQLVGTTVDVSEFTLDELIPRL